MKIEALNENEGISFTACLFRTVTQRFILITGVITNA